MSAKTLLGGALVIAGVAVVASMNGAFGDGGIDVSRTACEQLGSARQAVDREFQERTTAADETLASDLDKASDDYWAENRRLEDEHYECVNSALIADPCKAPFEEIGRLYEEIMADFDAGKGFNEAKFNEREAAKKRYNECVETAKKGEFYERDKTACDKALAAGQEANQKKRQAADARAQSAYESALDSAAKAKAAKHAELDAIEKKCNEPGGETNVEVGMVSTGSTGTPIKATSSACTGVFQGNDPDLQRRLSELESQLQKAKAAGKRDGLFGIDHIQSAIDEVKEELRTSGRSCRVDADCGDTRPVCCSNVQIGRVVCDGGYCASETTECVDPEFCAGSPAACVAPATGATSEPIQISRTIPEVGTCSQNLQTLNLRPASDASKRFSIAGNIPSWLTFSAVSGDLPKDVSVTYSCATVQGMGPGTYTANGSITIYNDANELINTIPLVITITVTPVEGSMSSTAVGVSGGATGATGGDTGSTSGGEEEEEQPEEEEPEETGVAISVTPAHVSFTYDHANPKCPLPAGSIAIGGPDGTSWKIVSSLPVWLRASAMSGKAPGSISLSFPCQLDRYENQEQSTTLLIIVTAPDGSETQHEVTVSGAFTNF